MERVERNRARVMILQPDESADDAVRFFQTGLRPEDLADDQLTVKVKGRWEWLKRKVGLRKENA